MTSSPSSARCTRRKSVYGSNDGLVSPRRIGSSSASASSSDVTCTAVPWRASSSLGIIHGGGAVQSTCDKQKSSHASGWSRNLAARSGVSVGIACPPAGRLTPSPPSNGCAACSLSSLLLLPLLSSSSPTTKLRHDCTVGGGGGGTAWYGCNSSESFCKSEKTVRLIAE